MGDCLTYVQLGLRDVCGLGSCGSIYMYIKNWPRSSGMAMEKWGLACLGISHGLCDGAAGDGLVPLVGVRYLLLAGSGGGGLPSPAHVGEGGCLVSEVSSGLGKYLSPYREGGRE